MKHNENTPNPLQQQGSVKSKSKKRFLSTFVVIVIACVGFFFWQSSDFTMLNLNSQIDERAADVTPAESRHPAEFGETSRAVFITQGLYNDSQAFSWKEFQRFCNEYGFEMAVFDIESNGIQQEELAINHCIEQGYEVIFINPNDRQGIVPALMKAHEAGIIIGMFSQDLLPEDQQHRHFFAGVDYNRAGEIAGQALVERFPNGARVVEVGGQTGHNAQIKYHEGFRKALENTNIELLDSQSCNDWLVSDAIVNTKYLINKYGDEIDGVFVHWDKGATGVIQTLHNAGMYDVFVVGVDGNRTGYQQVTDGTQAVSIGVNFSNMAVMSMDLARRMINGETVPAINFAAFDVITLKTIGNFPWPEW